MITKKVAAIAAAAVLAVGVGVYGIASAYGGGHGHGHGHGGLSLLAHAAGISGSSVRAAFQASNLKAQRATLKADRLALINCLISPSSTAANSCSSQASQYLTDKQSAASTELTVWEGLFATAGNKANAQSVFASLQQLQATRKQIFQQAFGAGSAASSDAPTTNQ